VTIISGYRTMIFWMLRANWTAKFPMQNPMQNRLEWTGKWSKIGIGSQIEILFGAVFSRMQRLFRRETACEYKW